MTPAIDWAALSQQPPWGPWPPGDPQNPGCLEAQERALLAEPTEVGLEA